MPSPYKCQFIELDPAVNIPTNVFETFSNQYAADKLFTGLAIQVQQGAHTAFWEALNRALIELTKTVNVQQLALGLAMTETPQDFTCMLRSRFWQNLKMLAIDGPTTEHCLRQVINQCQQQPELTHLSLNTAGMEAPLATALVSSLPRTIEGLDLSWNPIETSEASEASFQDFCQAVKTSALTSLTLSVKGTAECAVLKDALSGINRPFNLAVWPSPSIQDSDMDFFIDAMKENRNLTISFDNCLGFLNDPKRLQDLAALSETNKIPSLQHLLAQRLATLLKEGTFTLNDAARLPTPCIDLMPITLEEKAAIIAKRTLPAEAAATQSTSSEISDGSKRLGI